MRNLYNGRTDKPVLRCISFNDYSDMARFVNLYGDLFYRPVESCAKERSKIGFYSQVDWDGNKNLVFSIFRDDWDFIKKNLNFEYVGNRQKCWRFVS